MQILSLLPKVAAEIGAIAKSRKNVQQGYSFRGIDDVLNAVHGPLCKYCVTPTSEVADILREERTTAKGGLLIYTRLTLKVTWHAPDGSTVSTVTAGEAMDSADKSTNKAMSAALKYAYFQTFSIPLEEDEADQTTPEPAPKQPQPPAKQPEKRRLNHELGEALIAIIESAGKKPSQDDAEALLQFMCCHTYAEALQFGSDDVEGALNVISGSIADRMETLKATKQEAMQSIYAEAIEAAQKRRNSGG